LEANQQPDIISDAIDQFNQMLNDPQTFALIVGPMIILVILALFFAAWIVIKRRKEHAELSAVIRESDAELARTTGEQAVSLTTPSSLEEPLSVILEPEPEAPPTSALSADVEEVRNLDRAGWLKKLNLGLAKTRSQLVNNLASLFTGKKLDDELLEHVHEALFKADVGVQTADRLVTALKSKINGSEVMWEDARKLLKGEIQAILGSNQQPINRPASGPMVILIVGVNGVGKTTTIAKLAASFLAEDQQVLLCAADTFRAAAIDQLKVWGERLGVDVIAHKPGSDPAAVAYDAVKAAVARKVDVLLIDTAGRLHSKKELMDELGKINRVIGKDVVNAPHETWLVIDATTGQNALMQVKAFKEVVHLSGLVVTKLDGTAKGGVVIGASDQYDLPIRYVGVGEKAADLRPFSPQDYADQLFQ
jgi:fused signal recognition particle receptor